MFWTITLDSEIIKIKEKLKKKNLNEGEGVHTIGWAEI
jgi:hypothetical protein